MWEAPCKSSVAPLGLGRVEHNGNVGGGSLAMVTRGQGDVHNMVPVEEQELRTAASAQRGALEMNDVASRNDVAYQ